MQPYNEYLDPAEIVAARRTELGMSQAEVAKKIGMASSNFITMIELGRAKVPPDRAISLADALDMNRVWFIERVLKKKFPDIADELFTKNKIVPRD